MSIKLGICIHPNAKMIHVKVGHAPGSFWVKNLEKIVILSLWTQLLFEFSSDVYQWFNNLSIWQLKISFRSKLNSILTCNFNYLGIMKQLTSFFIQYGPRLLFLWEGRSGGAPEDLRFFPTFVLINFHDFKTSNQIKNEPGFRYLCISPISYT